MVLLCLIGCSSRSSESIPLTVISPHRDEIRLETAWAFQDWLAARTRDRADAASRALEAWSKQPAPAQEAAVTRAFEELGADWRVDDLPSLQQALRDWRAQPGQNQVEALRTALQAWQSRAHPVEIVWQDVGGGTSQIVRYVRSQFAADPDGIGIDVLFGGGTDNFLRLADEGLLERLDLPAAILERIRPELNGVPLYDPGHRWFGPVLSSFGILYNRDVLARVGRPEPQRWEDLGKPGLRGWVNAGDPRMTGSVHMVYEIILQGPLGWDHGLRLLMRLGANAHAFIRDSGTLTRTIIFGDAAAAGTLDVQALPAVGQYPALMTFALPPGETVINPDAVAVLKGAPQRGLAKAFVEFLLSDAGQRMFFLRPGQPGGPRRYPLCRLSVVEKFYQEYPPSVRSTGTTDPFTLRGTVGYDSRLSFRRWDALNDLFGAWIIDAHPDLAAAWRAVALAELPDTERQRLEEELFRPPCTEKELAAYARAITDGSPRTRTEMTTRWGEEARQRYRRVKTTADASR